MSATIADSSPHRPSASPGPSDFAAMPGPRFPAIVQSGLFLSSPFRFGAWATRRYGPMFRFKSAILGEMVYIADPALAKQVFGGDPGNLRAGVANHALRPVAGPDSILLLDGDRHMRMRKLMLPAFHGEAIKQYGKVMEQAAASEIDRMPLDTPVAIRDVSQAITLDVIVRAVFGIEEAAQQQELTRVLSRMIDFGPSVVFEWTRVELGGHSPWGRFVRNKRAVDDMLFAEMAVRREDPDLESRDDVFSLLLRARDEEGKPLTDDELRDELVTLLLAGHETTATAIAWAIERLVRNPGVLAKLRDDIASGDGSYMDATIKETLRARPVIIDVGRVVTEEPIELGGYRIPTGVHLGPSIGLIHFSPDVYPDPQAFRPERFLEGAPAPYSWIPFGGGVRRCIGAAFAQYEMKIVLSALVKRLDMRATTSKPERAKIRGVMLGPAKGAEVIVTAKRAA